MKRYIRFNSDTSQYLVNAYYDTQARELVESKYANDLTQANNIVNEYANEGYYIEVHNLELGTVIYFNPDTWFDDWDQELPNF